MMTIDDFIILHERLAKNPDHLKSKSTEDLLEIWKNGEFYFGPFGGLGLAATGVHRDDNKRKLRSIIEQIKETVFDRDRDASVWQPSTKGGGIKIIKGKHNKFLMLMDALLEMGFFVVEGTNQPPSRKALIAAIGQALSEDFKNPDQALALAYDAKDEATNTDFLVAIADEIRKKREAKLEGGKNK